MFKVPEKYRINKDLFGEGYDWGNNGHFAFKHGNYKFMIIASDHGGWEHVSVHIISGKTKLTPTWAQMCIIKNLFWSEEDTVIQYHPAKKDYVNLHNNVLHLWRPIWVNYPIPDKSLVI